ncbi:uncharacterized protein C18orf63 homolog [Symphorus nematophorus]
MSAGAERSMFFLRLPELTRLCCVALSVQEEDEEPRSKQIKTCRELVLLHSDILASPALDSFTEIKVVMAAPFFHKGILQVFGQRRRLQLGCPQCVSPGVLQCCLSYSLITRLSPSWNKAGLYLINGRDFLSESRRLNAVSLELSTTEGQLCLCIDAHAVRLPPTTLEDFGLPPLVLRRFCSDLDCVLDPSSTGGAVWCHVLPSMKKGQIITISRQLPRDGPFRTYRDLKNHWNRLYGYRLPDLSEEEVVYCSVYFRLLGERLFTYPLSCIRLQAVQRCPRVDLQGALGSFLHDVKDRLQSVCGFPARLTRKPRYCSVGLNTAAATTGQVLRDEEVNLTTSSSIRPVLTQLPPLPLPPPPPPPLLPPPPPASSLSSSSSSSSSLPLFQPASSLSFFSSSSSSSSSLPLFQPASSLSSSSSSSSILSPLPLPPPAIPAPKLVPIFKNKHPSRHVNVALLRLQKQTEQLIGGGGGEEKWRVTLPTIMRKTSATSSSSSSSSSSAASLLIPPPRTVPCFNRRPKPQPTAPPKLKHVSGLGPASESKPGLRFKSKSSPKSSMKINSENKAAAAPSGEPSAAGPEPPQPPLTSSDVSNKHSSTASRQGVVFESKPKKSRSAVRDVDVEKMARSHQLSRLSSVTLLSWLRGRGALVGAKHKKEELMLKVMSCLAEA